MTRDNEDRSPSREDEPTISNLGSPGVSSSVASGDSPSDGGEFAAGLVIAGRFRIVGRLGGGGMGDVYRADDHELGTSVALKFLPIELSGDPVRLERLRNEVRLARQVAHPNVCGVYDIGDADGRPFLSMEFIDGEDLASLLRRIGRLPKDKAIELAREICAGIGAAHELGVIHRDLKPANVMIDGRGKARVADFGLAAAAAELGDGRDAMAGTPAYMAPEQLRGSDATKQTDIFALGLVLYELFTGKRAHDVKTVAGLKERYSSSASPTSPSDLVEGMDPAVERVILHCLELEPENRPTSALAVMAALPGGDPLAAMLKAGEMPSPELVAASGRKGTLSPKRALQLAAIGLLGGAVSLWAYSSPSFGDLVGGILAPEVLSHQAELILTDLGCEIDAVDSAWGFDLDWDVAEKVGSTTGAEREALLQSEVRPLLRFWHRSSKSPMGPWRGALPGMILGNIVSTIDPPLTEDGMTLVRLGPRGRLIELRVMPGSEAVGLNRTEDEVVAAILDAALLEPSHIEPIEWRGVSPMPSDSLFAWRVDVSEPEVMSREVVAALSHGIPTWVRIDPDPDGGARQRLSRQQDKVLLIFFAFFVGGALVAALNIGFGRWDRRGAARLAAVAFFLCFSSNLIGAHHSLTAGQEVYSFFSAIAYGATRALMTWLLYIAIEPFIRRLHPSSLVSWSRLLAGRVSDPAIGRDVLVGFAVFGFQAIVMTVCFWALGFRDPGVPAMAFSGGDTPLDTAGYLAVAMRIPVVVLGSNLGFLLIYVIGRWLLGRLHRAAPLLLWFSMFLFFVAGYDPIGLPLKGRIVFAVATATASTYLVVRHGLLALLTPAAIGQILIYTVVTLDPSDWYFAQTAIFVLLVAGLTAFAVVTATDQKLLPGHS